MPGRESSIMALWLKDFSITEEDVEYLYEFILDNERPLTSDELALALIEKRYREEEQRLKSLLAEGRIYKPARAYEVGQKLFFPAFNFAPGTVVGVRPGYNPEYGSFQVIQVRFDGEDEVREFASQLPVPHKLDKESPEEWLKKAGTSPTQILERFGEVIKQKLSERLAQEEEFVSFGDQWLLKGMMPEIHLGHLNIAEAAIDIAGRPLPTEEILPSLELPSAHPKSIQLFSLNKALKEDGRFSLVGPKGYALWYLRRLEPPEVTRVPERLVYSPIPYAKEVLDEELIAVIRGIDDEATEEEFLDSAPVPGDSVTIALPYHHRRSGTLPIVPKTAFLFPEGEADYTMITFVDAVKGERFYGWAVHSARYVTGLAKWYDEIGAPVGAYLTLERGKAPLEVIIKYTPRRIKKEWVKAAKAQNDRLVFEMQLRPVGCDYDDLMMVAEEKSEKIDALWKKTEESGKTLYELLLQIFPELAKLSPQGTVHSRTIYTAINLVKRCPPAPILAELKARECFTYVGNGYWVFDESKV